MTLEELRKQTAELQELLISTREWSPYYPICVDWIEKNKTKIAELEKRHLRKIKLSKCV